MLFKQAHQMIYPGAAPIHHPISAAADATAFSIIGATFLGWLPHIAAGLSVVYLIIQIALAVRAWRKEE